VAPGSFGGQFVGVARGVAVGAGHGGSAKVAVAKFFEQVDLPSTVCSGLRPNGGGYQQSIGVRFAVAFR
jgi:hypothetical protein